MNQTPTIQLTLSITEVNQILEALGQRTYKDVFRLIASIQQQANAQLNAGDDPPSPRPAAAKESL
ncbi:MAG: hypothetical protein WBV59_21465 [Anaerolineae bacterium]